MAYGTKDVFNRAIMYGLDANTNKDEPKQPPKNKYHYRKLWMKGQWIYLFLPGDFNHEAWKAKVML